MTDRAWDTTKGAPLPVFVIVDMATTKHEVVLRGGHDTFFLYLPVTDNFLTSKKCLVFLIVDVGRMKIACLTSQLIKRT
jgi:hypothetical protein